MTVISLMLKFFYYNVLHIWSNTSFTTTRIKRQPFEFMGSSKSYATESGDAQSRFVEYIFISSNTWFLGKLKTVKTTIMILPRKLITQIEEQGNQLGVGIFDPIAATGGIGAVEQWKSTARNLLHWRKTIALLCFFPLIILGILFTYHYSGSCNSFSLITPSNDCSSSLQCFWKLSKCDR
jgi:hypothetical protein